MGNEVAAISRPDTIAPQCIEAEESTLGAILFDPSVLLDVKAIVEPADFFITRNQWVYEAILELYHQQIAIDETTVATRLRQRGQYDDIGGMVRLGYLVNSTDHYMHAASYAGLVAAAAHRRRLLAFASETAQLAIEANTEVRAMFREVDQNYRDVTVRLRSRDIVSGRTLLDEVWEDFEYQVDHPADVRGLPCGIQKLDQILMGFRPGLYAIGGASSMGKSTFAGGLVRSFANHAPGIYVPTEVRGKKALAKIVCDMAGIHYKRWLSGQLSQDAVAAFTQAYADFTNIRDNLTVIDSKQPNLAEIEAEIMRSGAKWLIVDSGTAMSYQNMNNGNGLKRNADMRTTVTWLCQKLQDISHDLPVIALWQTGRNSKDRAAKEPRINDFKESGSIEETADVCLGLYRHDYYVSRGEADANPTKYPSGTATVFVLKDRDGGAGDERVTLGFKMGKGFTAYVDPKLDGRSR